MVIALLEKPICNAMNDPSRRTFVKRSAATGITLSFAGLIRAHGGGGGDGTTTEATTETTTWEPHGTTYETTWETTWDPYGTTYDTTWETTWDPYGTTYDTTNPEETTAQPHDPKEWVLRLFALFTHVVEFPPEEDAPDKSGSIYGGTLFCILVSCNGNYRTIRFPIESGGYHESDHLIQAEDSDTAFPLVNLLSRDSKKTMAESQPATTPT
jgi:hypothetical protein